MKFVIITGRSGSGKSSCLHLLEDFDYYCIDNLPISLLPSLPRHLFDKEKVAIGIDIRNLPEDTDFLKNILQQLKDIDVEIDVVYLDTNDKALLERFSSTRRKHPLSDHSISLPEALSIELERLEPLQHLAKYRIDTSRLSIHQLQHQLKEIVDSKQHNISILFQSFGYKYGIPTDSDFVFDVRCLPNPYWEPELRMETGKDHAIKEFFLQYDTVDAMLSDIKIFIGKWLPSFKEDNRNYMTVSIGCTGGRHRSVYMTEALYHYFKNVNTNYVNLQIRHRELL